MMKYIIYCIFCLLALSGCKVAYAEPSEVVLQTLAMESASEPEGMPYVALTLINRARNRGTTPEIEALRPWQFSCWNKDRTGARSWARAWLGRHYTLEARKQALNAYSEGVAMASQPRFQGIRHYHTKAVHPKWAIGRTPDLVIGSHLFYKDIA